MVLFVVINSSDPLIGRIEKSALPQQTLMEIFVIGLTDPKAIVLEDPDDVVDYLTLEGLELNCDGEVSEIDFEDCDLKGTVNLEWLPSSVRILNMSSNRLHGTLALRELPEGIHDVNLRENGLSGTLCLENLPKSLEGLYLSGNQFFGSICLTQLPASLVDLNLMSNDLSGVIDLTSLPDGLMQLQLSANNFSGETDFSKLPRTLEALGLRDNPELSGVMTVNASQISHFVALNTRVQLILQSE